MDNLPNYDLMNLLREWGACPEGTAFAADQPDLRTAVERCPDSAWLVWFAMQARADGLLAQNYEYDDLNARLANRVDKIHRVTQCCHQSLNGYILRNGLDKDTWRTKITRLYLREGRALRRARRCFHKDLRALIMNELRLR